MIGRPFFQDDSAAAAAAAACVGFGRSARPVPPRRRRAVAGSPAAPWLSGVLLRRGRRARAPAARVSAVAKRSVDLMIVSFAVNACAMNRVSAGST